MLSVNLAKSTPIDMHADDNKECLESSSFRTVTQTDRHTSTACMSSA